mmetsp:Transcript_67313/g.209032  ORF Transcript_67313/g.209032 Transcript_67313/m.209032 type:complete len:1092 (+) Transcript_67313:98-3373(+)
MVFTTLFGTAALGTSGIWSYNRENFLYDRKMRQEQEFRIIDMRLKTAALWREDIRDIIDLTDKKMDNYKIVSALQLGFTVTMFTEGRLEPGTPEWLLWLYMISLAGAFLFLLMSLWFAMHASVVAQSNAVRLLTQLVRLPVPSWEQIEATRTYSYAFEGVPAAATLRVPLLHTISEGSQAGPGGIGAPDAADPWGLERRGHDIYELQRRALTSNRHIRLVQEAMRQWQAYDAFARLSMTTGTLLLCLALSHYVLGYILIQDGAPWAAWATVMVFLGVATTLMQLDLSMTAREKRTSQVLLAGGTAIVCVAAADWATYSRSVQAIALAIIPFAYLLNALFMLLFLRLCRVVKQADGSLLPTSLRGVLYIDVFGWLLRGGQPSEDGQASEAAAPAEPPRQGEAAARSSAGPGLGEQEVAEETADSLKANRPSSQPGGGAAEASSALVTGARRGEQKSEQGLRPGGQLREVEASAWSVPVFPDCAAVPPCSAQEEVFSAPESAQAGGPAWQSAPTHENVSTVLREDPMPEPLGAPASFSPLLASSFAPSSASSSSSSSARSSAAPSRELPAWQKRRRSTAALHGQSFPRHFHSSCPVALRPDDVDTATCDPDDPNGACSARRKAAAALKAAHRQGHATSALLGVGLAGVVPHASEDTFAPKTFAPPADKEAAQDEHKVHMEPIDTGHDLFRPGQLPWHAYRAAGLFLTALWLLGASWSLGQAFRVPDIPDQVLPESVSISGQLDSSAAAPVPDPLELLAGGYQVRLNWPHDGFQPTGISCDPEERRFAFSDGFQLYFASLGLERRLAAGDSTASSSGLGQQDPVLAGLQPAPRCEPLEGQSMLDVAVHCRSHRAQGGLACRALVLHDRGGRVAQCDLGGPSSPPEGVTEAVQVEAAEGSKEGQPTWGIVDRWLQDVGVHGGREHIISVAFDGSCAETLVDALSLEAGDPCVLVGTTHERVVELRQHLRQGGKLVPSGALWNVPGWKPWPELMGMAASSPLHVLPGRCLAVLQRQHVHAIDMHSAQLLGKWELPKHPGRNWTGIAGGLSHLYLMSLTHDGEQPELWQFPLPEVVQVHMQIRRSGESGIVRDTQVS